VYHTCLLLLNKDAIRIDGFGATSGIVVSLWADKIAIQPHESRRAVEKGHSRSCM
jgi:hypothetical protein